LICPTLMPSRGLGFKILSTDTTNVGPVETPARHLGEPAKTMLDSAPILEPGFVQSVHMSTVHLQLSDDLRFTAEARAAADGFTSLDEYIASLIRADQRDDAPAEVKVDSAPDALEQMLRAGISSGTGREITDQEWEQKQQSLIARHSKTNNL
jgi:hypothetical protein